MNVEKAMMGAVARRLLFDTDKRCLLAFLYNCGLKGLRAVIRNRRRRPDGGRYPPFLFISVTNACNLSCIGCWVTPSDPPKMLSPASLDRLITESKARGTYFFGILGGEPLLYEGLFEVIARHPDAYFQVFTNGVALTDDLVRRMRQLANVTPLVSIEGREKTSDERRGGGDVYVRAIEAVRRCARSGLVTGVATSVCRMNFDEVVSRRFIDETAAMGAHYLWYYIYRPAGPRPAPELALDSPEIETLRRFIVQARRKAPLVIVDAYWDGLGRPLCPAVAGISHHISPSGDVEFCPPIQFAFENIADGRGSADLIARSKFLGGLRRTAGEATRGCILLEQPRLLLETLQRFGAYDSSGRGTAWEELRAMTPRPSHNGGGARIPEAHLAYRFAKHYWLFGLGAYG